MKRPVEKEPFSYSFLQAVYFPAVTGHYVTAIKKTNEKDLYKNKYKSKILSKYFLGRIAVNTISLLEFVEFWVYEKYIEHTRPFR